MNFNVSRILHTITKLIIVYKVLMHFRKFLRHIDIKKDKLPNRNQLLENIFLEN